MSEHQHGQRVEDDPWVRKAKLFMDMINRVGFPILVCIWLAYERYTQGNKIIEAMDTFKGAVVSLTNAVNQQTKIYKHRHDDD